MGQKFTLILMLNTKKLPNSYLNYPRDLYSNASVASTYHHPILYVPIDNCSLVIVHLKDQTEEQN